MVHLYIQPQGVSRVPGDAPFNPPLTMIKSGARKENVVDQNMIAVVEFMER
jgi:hypothetical protein